MPAPAVSFRPDGLAITSELGSGPVAWGALAEIRQLEPVTGPGRFMTLPLGSNPSLRLGAPAGPSCASGAIRGARGAGAPAAARPIVAGILVHGTAAILLTMAVIATLLPRPWPARAERAPEIVVDLDATAPPAPP